MVQDMIKLIIKLQNFYFSIPKETYPKYIERVYYYYQLHCNAQLQKIFTINAGYILLIQTFLETYTQTTFSCMHGFCYIHVGIKTHIHLMAERNIHKYRITFLKINPFGCQNLYIS